MISTTPSELILNDDCSLARHYKYTRRLRPRTEGRSPTLASGTAVHYTVEHFCRNYGGSVPEIGDLSAHAEECLRDEFRNDDDGGEKNVKRFTPGVVRALKRIPEWIWLWPDWRVEQDISGTFHGEQCIPQVGGLGFEPLDVELHGRTDMFRFTDGEGAPTLEIVDIKTTANDPLDFLLWTPQLRMYAAILAQLYPDRLIVYQYLCVPTGVRDSVPHSAPFIFTQSAHERTVADILRMARKLGVEPEPREARRCSWCEYRHACIARITGGDVESLIKEVYVERPKHNDERRV